MTIIVLALAASKRGIQMIKEWMNTPEEESMTHQDLPSVVIRTQAQSLHIIGMTSEPPKEAMRVILPLTVVMLDWTIITLYAMQMPSSRKLQLVAM